MLKKLSIIAALAISTPSIANAAEIDCKTLLCMAGGFPSGCEDAFAYMMARVIPFPSLPPFGTCTFTGFSSLNIPSGKVDISAPDYNWLDGLEIEFYNSYHHSGENSDGETWHRYDATVRSCGGRSQITGGGGNCRQTYRSRGSYMVQSGGGVYSNQNSGHGIIRDKQPNGMIRGIRVVYPQHPSTTASGKPDVKYTEWIKY